MSNNALRLLAIDDNPDNLITLKAMILDAFPGALVKTATNGPAGLEMAISELPEVILLDIVMPVMDGLTVCRKLKADPRTSPIPVVILTAQKGDRQARIDALEAGAEAFLAKPIDEVELTAQIKAMIKIKASGDFQRQEVEYLSFLVDERTHAIEKELLERRLTEKELQKANFKLKQTQAETLNLLEDLQTEMSAHKKSEEALKESEERHRYISTTISDLAYSCRTTPEGLFVLDWMTGAAENLTGFTATEILERKCWRFLVFQEDIPLFEQNVTGLTPGCAGRTELRIRKKNGETAWVESYVECVAKNDNPDIVTLYGGIVDITERKNYEAKLVMAKEKAEESDRLKSAFLANMSHEIRTPMNGIIGFSELLREPDIEEAERNRFVRIIHDNCQQLLHIVSDIIDISKIEAGLVEIETADYCLNELLDSIYENYLPKAQHKEIILELHKDLVCNACSIAGDQTKIRQVIENLLTNALKFTAKGTISFGYYLDDKHIRFYVKDTGIGIDNQYHTAIFNRFWQVETGLARKYGGTGLGLAISRAYIRKMGGDITVESMQGEGACFKFSIPYFLSGQETHQAMGKIIHHDTFPGKTILIVEDEACNFEFLRIILMKMNIRLLHAWNGAEAMKFFEEHDEIDLILMDFKLPDISGQEVTRQIRATGKRVPVIATTAYAMAGDREKALQAGCSEYLPKPIRAAELKNMLNQFLGD